MLKTCPQFKGGGALPGALAAALLAACSGPSNYVCAPGQSVACTSLGGCSGAQVCLPTGLGFGECQCPAEPGPVAQGGDGGSGADAGGPTNPGGATVRVTAKAVEHCSVDPPVSPGLSRVTPKRARAGVLRLELLRERDDLAATSVALGSEVIEVDLYSGGVVGEGKVPPGTYRFVRLSLAYGAVSVPAVAHPGGGASVPGVLELDVATVSHTRRGQARARGETQVTFTANVGPSITYASNAPLDCPLSEAGGLVDITGTSYQITVPVPGGALVVQDADPAQELALEFPLAGSVTWKDLAATGFSAGVLDIVGSLAGSETPHRLPVCDLFLADRCQPQATPVHSTPAGPMPDSATTACTSGGFVSTCPAPGAEWHGQDGCYATHPAQLVVDGDVVRDQVTGLTWQRDTSAADLDWWEARDYCDALVLGGRSDWALPSRLELVSIVDNGRIGPAIDTAAFPDTASDFYWSGSPCLFSHLAFGVRFDQGFVYDHDPKTTAKVRCVSGGLAGPPSRLVASVDTVYDSSTGLTWQRALFPKVIWKDALAACEALSLAGKSDWRLPSHKELLTIVEDRALSPSIDVSAFPDTPPECQWASSAGLAPSTYAWSVSFTDGYTLTAEATQLYSFRCVRGS